MAHGGDDRGQEETEGVERHEISHLGDAVGPALPVGQCGLDVALVICIGCVGEVVLGQAMAYSCLFFFAEESSSLWLQAHQTVSQS